MEQLLVRQKGLGVRVSGCNIGGRRSERKAQEIWSPGSWNVNRSNWTREWEVCSRDIIRES